MHNVRDNVKAKGSDDDVCAKPPTLGRKKFEGNSIWTVARFEFSSFAESETLCQMIPHFVEKESNCGRNFGIICFCFIILLFQSGPWYERHKKI